jgi:hypothetical protein
MQVIKNIELGKFNWDKKKQKQFELNLEKWNCISKDRREREKRRQTNRRFTEICEYLL